MKAAQWVFNAYPSLDPPSVLYDIEEQQRDVEIQVLLKSSAAFTSFLFHLKAETLQVVCRRPLPRPRPPA